ncbi:MAG: tlde1 domain-containing protein [Pararhizobium sp.]
MKSRRKAAAGKPGIGVGLAAGLCLAATFAIVQTAGLSLSSDADGGPQAWMAPEPDSPFLQSVRDLLAEAKSSVRLPGTSPDVASTPAVPAADAVVAQAGAMPTVAVERSSRFAVAGSAPIAVRGGRFVASHEMAAASPAGRIASRPHAAGAAKLPHPSDQAVHSTLMAALSAPSDAAPPRPALAPASQVPPINAAVAKPLPLPSHTNAATALAEAASKPAAADGAIAVASAEPLPKAAVAVAAPLPPHAAVPAPRPEMQADAAEAPMVVASAEPVAPLDTPQAIAPLPTARPEAATEVEASNPAVQAGDSSAVAAVPPADDALPGNVPLPIVRPERPTAIARVAPQPTAEPAPAPPQPVTPRAPQTELAYAKPEQPTFSWGNIFGRRPATAALPGVGSGIAVYDIDAATVYMPNGAHLEAHSGLGAMVDDPRYVKKKNRGPTPPGRYNLVMREHPFHGVEAVRLLPVDGVNTFGRDGLLAHTYMFRGGKAESNGCVVFKDYKKFLKAFKAGRVNQIVVVARLSDLPEMMASR